MAIQREREIGYWAARPIPEIIYVGDINKESSPYHLHINAPLLSELFKEELGMTSEKVSRTKVAVVGKGGWNYHSPIEVLRDFPMRRITLGSSSLFYDNQGRHRAVIFTDNIVREVKKARSAFVDFSEKAKREPSILNTISEKVARRSTDSQANSLLITKRLLCYLKEADRGRLNKFLDKLLPTAVERYALAVLSHEGKHVSESWRGGLFLVKELGKPLGAGVTVGLVASEMVEYLEIDPLPGTMITLFYTMSSTYFAYLLTGAEKRAHKVAKEVKTKYRWADVVTFKVNRPWDEL